MLTVKVNNSTNTNKTNNHLKVSKTKETTTYDVGPPDSILGQAQICGGFNQKMESQPCVEMILSLKVISTFIIVLLDISS